MARFEGQFSSIVFVGRQNPQILNHNFLSDHSVLPKDKPPFRELFAKRDSQPFTEFISTPVLASIKYGPISIVVEENRYQITHRRFEDPPSSPIIAITKKYFGELLRYTPLQLGGFNLNGIIHFGDINDERAFDKQLGVSLEPLSGFASSTDVRIGVVFSFPWHNGIVAVELSKPKDRSNPGRMNFNYEFKYQDIDSFLVNLDDFPRAYGKFMEFTQWLRLELVR